MFPVLFQKFLVEQYERGIASDILPKSAKCIINCTEVCLLKIERGYIDFSAVLPTFILNLFA